MEQNIEEIIQSVNSLIEKKRMENSGLSGELILTETQVKEEDGKKETQIKQTTFVVDESFKKLMLSESSNYNAIKPNRFIKDGFIVCEIGLEVHGNELQTGYLSHISSDSPNTVNELTISLNNKDIEKQYLIDLQSIIHVAKERRRNKKKCKQ